MKKKLNINKIRLYRILHNIRELKEMPTCNNCHYNNGKKDTCWGKGKEEYEVKVDKEIRTLFCCNKWKRSDEDIDEYFAKFW